MLVGLAAFASWHSPATLDASELPQQAMQASMQRLFQTLTTVFPLSLSKTQFQAPENRQTIQIALAGLASQAEHLEHHGQGGSPTFNFLRRSLASDAQEALRRFEQGEYHAAQFTVHQLLENCFACHSKLPPARRSILGARFMESPEISRLSRKEQARLAVATRQFDRALILYEAMLQTTTVSAREIDLMGGFEDYLKVAIRVQNDFVRPIIILQQFLERQDVPAFLRQHINDWLEALRSIASSPPPADVFSHARTLIQDGQRRNRFPADRRGLVHFVVASGMLHRYLDSDLVDQQRMAEAYYLLGITESYISRSLWHDETEFFLETAVRVAPSTPLAREAFAFLEDYVMTRYTGSAGLQLPTDVQQHLTELRQLIEQGKMAK
jgi:hypothetical protein